VKPKKPGKSDPFKGMKKVIPIRPPEKKLSFEEKVEKFGEYMHVLNSSVRSFLNWVLVMLMTGVKGIAHTARRKMSVQFMPTLKTGITLKARKVKRMSSL